MVTCPDTQAESVTLRCEVARSDWKEVHKVVAETIKALSLTHTHLSCARKFVGGFPINVRLAPQYISRSANVSIEKRFQLPFAGFGFQEKTDSLFKLAQEMLWFRPV